MDIQHIRQEIDNIDTQLVDLFRQRMEKAASVAEYKKANNMNIYDPARERALLQRVSDLAGEEHEANTRLMFSLLMDLSKSYQAKLLLPESKYEKLIDTALSETSPLFPEKATVACQGTEGAYAQVACNKLFSLSRNLVVNLFV